MISVKTTLEQFREANSIEDLAKILGYTPKSLSYLIYVLSPEAKYYSFEIKKRSGGKRQILRPHLKLKFLQKILSFKLYECLLDVSNSTSRPDSFSHAFQKGKSITSNARQHRNKRWVFSTDLEDFFGSINFGRVRGALIKDRSFQFKESVATLIAQIVCFDNKLPQGAPTSPIISNIVARSLDVKLVGIAAKHGCVYTRYADDITFSTNKSIFPVAIACAADSDPNFWTASEALTTTISNAGFKENKAKTRMQYKRGRQVVTGLVVNKRINVQREYRKSVRIMVRAFCQKGSFYLPKFLEHRVQNKGNSAVSSPTKVLQGMLGFIDSIDIFSDKAALQFSQEEYENKKKKSYKTTDLKSQEKIYKQFLLHVNFFKANSLTVLTEGKSDNIHLRCALKSIGHAYSSLSAKGTDGETLPLFRIMTCEPRRTNALLGLCGGVSDMAHFARDYAEEKGFKFEWSLVGEKVSPVIMLLDNDSGWQTFKKRCGDKKPKQISESLYLVRANLYIVLTPLSGGAATSSIEDMYPPEVRNILIDGKKFDPSNDTVDTGDHYGKMAFAEKIIKSGLYDVDFSSFNYIFNKFIEVEKHWMLQDRRFC